MLLRHQPPNLRDSQWQQTSWAGGYQFGSVEMTQLLTSVNQRFTLAEALEIMRVIEVTEPPRR